MEKYKVRLAKFSVLQWFFWSSWATYGGYLVYYLSDMGYSNIEIGTIISTRTLLGLLGEPILGYLSDSYHTNKKIFILGMLAIAVVALPFPYYNWWLILITTGIIGFFWAPQQSILDSWILKSSSKLASNYGFMRAWGSLGFAVMVVIFGKVFDVFGWGILFISFTILLTIASVIASFIKDVPHNNLEYEVELTEKNDSSHSDNIESNNFSTDNKRKANISDNNISRDITDNKSEKVSRNPLILFKNIEYTMLILSAILVFIPNNIIFIYLPNFIKGVGGTTTLLGVVLFINAVSEAPIFFLGKKMLVKFKPIPLLLLSTIFYLLRVIIVYEATSQINFLFFASLQSLSFGVLLITSRFHINLLAPEHLRTTAQSMFTMSIFGVGGIIASMFGGAIMDYYGMSVLYRISLGLSVTGILMISGLLFYRRIRDKQA
ncbi:MAG: MFS transporter [bacterium]